MKLSTRQDVACSSDDLFAAISNYAFFERQLHARGIEVVRVMEGNAEGLGTTWEAEYDFRGRTLAIRTEVTQFKPGCKIASLSHARGLEAMADFSVEPVTASKSRLIVGIDIRPTSIAGRVLLQPVKLAKTTISERFATRVAAFARKIEAG